MKGLSRVGVERGERESFQVSVVGHATFLFSFAPLTEADGGLRRLKLPGCCPLLALLSLIPGYTFTRFINQLHNGCCIDLGRTFIAACNKCQCAFFIYIQPQGRRINIQNSITYLLIPSQTSDYQILLMHLNFSIMCGHRCVIH